jgi:hypothetical protein
MMDDTTSRNQQKQAEAVDINHMVATDPHDATSQASSSMPMSWSEHRQRIVPIPFVCKRKENCNCSCCEQPFGDNEIAKDIYVVYARWDNHKKQFIPVCARDHVFEDPPLFTSSGLMWEVVGTCFFVAIALTVILLVTTSNTTDTYNDGHRHRPYQDSSSGMATDTVAAGLVVAAVGPFLLIACVAAGVFNGMCTCFSKEGSKTP